MRARVEAPCIASCRAPTSDDDDDDCAETLRGLLYMYSEQFDIYYVADLVFCFIFRWPNIVNMATNEADETKIIQRLPSRVFCRAPRH